MKILAVGDVHGEWDKINNLINKKKPDIVLQCGDFGWWPILEKSKSTVKDCILYPKWKVDGVKCQGAKVYWCDGNHEQFPALRETVKALETENKRDPVLLYDQVYYCPRGSVINLPDGRTVMFIGGAESIDRHERITGYDHFEEELISYNEQNFILDYPHKVDIIVSHTCPEGLEPRESFLDYDKNHDPTGRILKEVHKKFKPSLWIHGHYHQYKHTKTEETDFYSLSCPGHNGRWWAEIKTQ